MKDKIKVAAFSIPVLALLGWAAFAPVPEEVLATQTIFNQITTTSTQEFQPQFERQHEPWIFQDPSRDSVRVEHVEMEEAFISICWCGGARVLDLDEEWNPQNETRNQLTFWRDPETQHLFFTDFNYIEAWYDPETGITKTLSRDGSTAIRHRDFNFYFHSNGEIIGSGETHESGIGSTLHTGRRWRMENWEHDFVDFSWGEILEMNHNFNQFLHTTQRSWTN